MNNQKRSVAEGRLNNHENATHFAGDCNQKYFLNYQLQEFVMAWNAFAWVNRTIYNRLLLFTLKYS